MVRARRGDRLVGADKDIFSGGFDSAFTENLAADVLAAIEERLIWNRFGL
jgi:hypothetical protein